MDKEKYLLKSKKLGLSNRCPLVGICERWAMTIFFYKFFDSHTYRTKQLEVESTLIRNGIINEDFLEKSIRIKAEYPEFLRTNDRVSYCNMCPEVSLFYSINSLTFSFGTASISGEWDSFWTNEEFRNEEYRHYSECLEFSQFIFEELDKPTISKFFKKVQSKRTPISSILRFEIFTRDDFTCQYCGKNVNEGAKLHVDHKIPISKGGKDTMDNYITSCSECNLGKSNKII